MAMPRVFGAICTLVVIALASPGSARNPSAGEPGQQPDSDPSLVVDGGRRIDPKVENGTAYDRATVDLGAARKVVLPDTAVVGRGGVDGKVRLFMAKTLSFVGHPPAPMSLAATRANMGCAVRAEGDSLVVATYGEWDSRREGDARLRLVAVLPDDVRVEQRQGLSGPESVGHGRQGPHKPDEAPVGHWYGPAAPAEGWTKVPTVADPERTAGPEG